MKLMNEFASKTNEALLTTECKKGENILSSAIMAIFDNESPNYSLKAASKMFRFNKYLIKNLNR